ncbi:MAG: GNAT family N-acetyltransferase [Bdellovibrionota bacterium]
MRINTREISADDCIRSAQIFSDDYKLLGALMLCSYRVTIDDEGETDVQCIEEIKGTLAGKYGPFLDFASFMICDSEKALSASAVTEYKGKPLLAFSMTNPTHQGKGYARFLIERSISALFKKGWPELYLVVTEGNAPAEFLYQKLGFKKVGPALPQQPPPTS